MTEQILVGDFIVVKQEWACLAKEGVVDGKQEAKGMFQIVRVAIYVLSYSTVLSRYR